MKTILVIPFWATEWNYWLIIITIKGNMSICIYIWMTIVKT